MTNEPCVSKPLFIVWYPKDRNVLHGPFNFFARKGSVKKVVPPYIQNPDIPIYKLFGFSHSTVVFFFLIHTYVRACAKTSGVCRGKDGRKRWKREW